MELPLIQREVAHQAKQEERESVLSQGQGNSENTLIGEAGESHRQTEPSPSGLGAVPPSGGGESDLQSDGQSDLLAPCALGEKAASAKVSTLVQKPLLATDQ